MLMMLRGLMYAAYGYVAMGGQGPHYGRRNEY